MNRPENMREIETIKGTVSNAENIGQLQGYNNWHAISIIRLHIMFSRYIMLKTNVHKEAYI